MEFLMTYGWVIMAVMVAIGALSYFGLLSPERLLPSRCSLPAGINCLDFIVDSASITLVLQNNVGGRITINRVAVGNVDSSSCFNNVDIVVNNNQKAIISISGCSNGNMGERFKGELNVTYTKESLLTHVSSGTINARVSSQTVISSSSICQNAQDNGLCSGLDIVFGVGYQAACCSEQSLCCP